MTQPLSTTDHHQTPAAAPRPTITATPPAGQDAEALIAWVQSAMLKAMVGDSAAAAEYFAADAVLMFVGRRLKSADDIGRFNATRYKWVKKRIEQWDVAFGAERTIVTSLGALYGEWPDGTPFDDNRYIDRFIIVDGRITRMDVWNDSAELLLGRAGLAQD